MSSIFSKIVTGEIPCFKVAESENHLAFLDINPLKRGHTLVIPKKEIDYIFDMDDVELANLTLFAKKVAKAMKASIACTRIGVSVIGLEVPHTHIHLIPMDRVSDMNFSNPKLQIPMEEHKEIADRMHATFTQMFGD